MDNTSPRVGRPALALVIGLLLILSTIAVYHARRALERRAHPDVVAAINELAARLSGVQPGEVGSEAVFLRVIDAAATRLAPNRPGTPVGMLTDRIKAGDSLPLQRDEFAALVAELEQAGAFRDLDALVLRPAVRMPEYRHPLGAHRVAGLAPSRDLATVATTMMVQSWRRAEWRGVTDSLRRVLTLAQLWVRQPAKDARAVGEEIFLSAARELRYELLATRPPDRVLAELQEVIRAFEIPPVSYAAAGERLITVDNFRAAVQRQGPANIHAGRHEPSIDRFCLDVVAMADDPGREVADPPHTMDRAAIDYCQSMASVVRAVRASTHAALAARAGTDALIAVERFIAQRGTVPGRWTELVPALLPAPPSDPWNSTPIMLRSGGSFGAGTFMVYAFGPDARDNGGQTSASGPSPADDWVYTLPRPAVTGQSPG
jgi:hypothetical protein